MLASDLMTKEVIFVRPDAKLKDVARLFKQHRINGVPVVDEQGAVIGVITMTDMLKMLREIQYLKQMEERLPQKVEMKECLIEEKNTATVAMKMTKPVWKVEHDMDIDYVLDLMCNQNIHTIPVIKDGKLVGVIGGTDIVDACI